MPSLNIVSTHLSVKGLNVHATLPMSCLCFTSQTKLNDFVLCNFYTDFHTRVQKQVFSECKQANRISELLMHNTECNFLQRHYFILHTRAVIAENGNDGKQILRSSSAQEEWGARLRTSEWNG